MQRCILLVICLLFSLATAQAGTPEAYRQAINLAAAQHEPEAIAALSSLAEALAKQSPWQERALAAQSLLKMKAQQQTLLPSKQSNPYLNLAASYAEHHPLIDDAHTWPATLLATIFPGAGHAWLGRWNDAKTAALMVWPMLILTLWAFKRGMGPVTAFFALITLWLWSGTVFSATSLAERGSLEAYFLWWQHIWQASGLPARPW